MAPQSSQWGDAEELLAVLIERTDAYWGMFYKAHFKGPPWKPLELPRPQDISRPAQPASWRDLFRSLQA